MTIKKEIKKQPKGNLNEHFRYVKDWNEGYDDCLKSMKKTSKKRKSLDKLATTITNLLYIGILALNIIVFVSAGYIGDFQNDFINFLIGGNFLILITQSYFYCKNFEVRNE